MKQKTSLVLWASAVMMFGFLIASCAGDREREAEEETTEAVVEVAEPSVEMTDDIYVEIMARHMYLADQYSEKATDDMSQAEVLRLSTEISEKMEAVYGDLGVTSSAYEAYAAQIMEDIEAFGAIMERAGDRAQELKGE